MNDAKLSISGFVLLVTALEYKSALRTSSDYIIVVSIHFAVISQLFLGLSCKYKEESKEHCRRWTALTRLLDNCPQKNLDPLLSSPVVPVDLSVVWVSGIRLPLFDVSHKTLYICSSPL